MSKGFIQRNKKVLFVHFLSLGVLVLGFLFCRYGFFGLHGMREWPEDLLIVGMAALLISLFARKQYAPWFTSVGYFVWFWLGVIFNRETVDAHGTRGDTMPFIWLWGFLGCILVGFLLELVLKWWKLLHFKTKEE